MRYKHVILFGPEKCTSYVIEKNMYIIYIYEYHISYHIIYTHTYSSSSTGKESKRKEIVSKKKAKENDGSWRESQFINLINDYHQSKVVKSKSPKRGPREEAGEG